MSGWKEEKWDEHIIRMNAERLVKMSRGNIPARRIFSGLPKRRWSDLIPD